MKNVLKTGLVLVVTAIIFSGCASSYRVTEIPVNRSITYQNFYDDLSPYGTWINYPGYGNVWNPRMDAGFRPYATNGHWTYSNEGWAWQSNYNWGWAPFHYGRWMHDDMYGWLWMPGYDWSPAWVTWGSADDYYAWAPLMPEVNVNAQYGNWRPHSYYWNVCNRNRIYDRNLSNAIVRQERNTTIVNNITIINNYNTSRGKNYYARGPEINEVQKYTNRKIEPVAFKDAPHLKKINHQAGAPNDTRPVIELPPAAGINRQGANETNPINNTNRTAPLKENNINNQHPINRQPVELNPLSKINSAAPIRENNINNQQPVSKQPVETNPLNKINRVAPIKENNINNQQPINGQPVETKSPMLNRNNRMDPNNNQAQPADKKNTINQQPNQAPQPRQFTRPAAIQSRPVRNINQPPDAPLIEQRKNIEQLPVQKTIDNTNAPGKRIDRKKIE